MNAAGLWIVTVIYAGQSAWWIRTGQYVDALIIAGYVIANLGLIAKVSA